MFWNVQGFANIYKLDSNEIEFVLQHDIICLNETWLNFELSKVPHFLENYQIYHQSAKKEASTGRGIGGLAVFVKDSIKKVNIIVKELHWIFLNIETDSDKFILGFTYFSPSYEYNTLLNLFKDTLNCLSAEHPNDLMIIGGDFNVKIGEENQSEEALFADTSLFATRSASDCRVDKKGRELLEVLENDAFYLVNGRSIGDYPAKVTFVGARGKSILDLIWININMLPYVKNFFVNSDIFYSDHFICTLSLLSKKQKANSALLTKSNVVQKIIFQWDPSTAEAYTSMLEESDIFKTHARHQIDDYYNSLCQIIKNISITAGASKTVSFNTDRHRISYNKPWYDDNCKEMKKEVKHHLKMCRANSFNDDYTMRYLQKKKELKTYINMTKKAYNKSLKDRLSNIHNQTEFWSTVNKLNKKQFKVNPIKLEIWEQHFKTWYGTKILNDILFIDVRHPYLDSDITFQELNVALAHLKPRKSPGIDSITNEHLKLLPHEGKRYLLDMFNTFLTDEEIPKNLVSIKLTLLHKKGDENETNNYRALALCSNIMKLFTFIINSRIQIWTESHGILPEAQSGFRKNRSTVDNLFVINALIQTQLTSKKEGFYAIFVDYEKAFDSVRHDILWQKIFDTGISGKLTRLLKNIYDQAEMILELKGETSQSIPISKGVLQGECSSPILFSLYISDIEDYFRAKGLDGIYINHKFDILTLQYADDMVIFAKSPTDLSRKLKALEEYNVSINLKINASKTKIMHFHLGRPPTQRRHYYCQGEQIFITKTYTYLGITFTSSGSYNSNTKVYLNKASRASGAVKNTMKNSKLYCCNTLIKLYNSVVLPTLLYGSEIWAINQLEAIERGQSNFFKSFWGWAPSTPNYLVRHECKQTKLEVKVIKRVLKLWNKILLMSQDRYVRICYDKLLVLSNNVRTDNSRMKKYNWVFRLGELLEAINYNWLWQSQNFISLKSESDNIIEAYTRLFAEEDLERIQNSTYNPRYEIYLEGREYLLSKAPYSVTKLISQLRMSGCKIIKFFAEGSVHSFVSEEFCSLCNLHEHDTLHHFFYRCPIFTPLRTQILPPPDPEDDYPLATLLTSVAQTSIMYKVYNFVMASLKLRAFIMNV